MGIDLVLDILQGDFAYGSLWDFPAIMGAASLAHDAALLAAARTYPNMTFVGTHPGLVSTDVMAPTISFTGLQMLVKAMLSSVARNRFDAGKLHSQILASPNLQRSGIFFNSLLHGRKCAPAAYNISFQNEIWKHVRHGIRKM